MIKMVDKNKDSSEVSSSEVEKTGIEGLDEELGGGLPKNSTVLLLGPPGSGKTTFINQFINYGLEKGEGGLYISMDNAPDEVKDTVSDFDWNFGEKEKEGDLVFIDAYSWRLGGETEGKFVIQGPSDLNQMNMTLSDALREVGKKDKRIALDSVSTLILYTNPSSSVKFLQVVGAKSKASKGTLLLSIEEGVHDEKTITTLNYVADGVIEMKLEGNERYMRVSRMAKTSHSREWKKFKITDNGIEMI